GADAPGDRVAQERQERVALPRASERERRRVGRVRRAGRADRRIVAVAQREVGDRALAYLTRVADDARLAVGLQRGVGRVERADRRRRGAGAVVGGQQDSRRGRVLELDEVRLVLDDERRAERARERRVAGLHVDADLADGWMREEVATEKRVM